MQDQAKEAVCREFAAALIGKIAIEARARGLSREQENAGIVEVLVELAAQTTAT